METMKEQQTANDGLTTEEKILAAAGKVFTRKGMAGARMQDIANEAGINKALLHYYFRSKEKLFDAIFEKTFQQFVPLMHLEFDSTDDFRQMLRNMVRLYVMMVKKSPYLPSFLLNEMHQNPDKIQHLLLKMNVSEFPKRLQIRFSEAGITGDPRQLLLTLISGVIFPFAAKPLLMPLFFGNNEKIFDRFIEDRSVFLEDLMLRMLVNREEDDINLDSDNSNFNNNAL